MPTLFSSAELIGSDVLDGNENAIGAAVDVMRDRSDKEIAFLVIPERGIESPDRVKKMR